jgi:Kef-type K+ transport system membrane component KefB
MQSRPPFPSLDTRPGRLALAYVIGLALTVGLSVGVFWLGERVFPTRGILPTTPPPETVNLLLHVLLTLAVVIVTARVVGALFQYLRQPPVIGEVVGGILLGPSLVGALWPAAYAFIMPPDVAPLVGVLAQFGVVLYMFIVGLHLDLSVLRTSGRAMVAISHASVAAPFLLGVALALPLFGRLAGEGVGFTAFALFLGVSMSVTAFPVLARILDDKGLQKTRLGILALTCAAVVDVTAWCLLALVVGMTRATMAQALLTLGLTMAYLVVMFAVVRRAVGLAAPFVERAERLDQGGLAAIVVALLLSSLATEVIGIHAIFGAFMLGAVIPHTSRVAEEVTERLEDMVRVLFLPAFFAFTGMRTEIGLMASWQDWAISAAIVAVATAGKLGGTFLAARYVGLGRRMSAALGILMNTRGLVELVVLNIGLDIGVISPRLFTMLVIMALVTTFMTTPLVERLMPVEEG